MQTGTCNLPHIAVCRTKHSYSSTATSHCVLRREGLVERTLKQGCGSRTRAVHLFQKNRNPEEKVLHLHMVVLLFLYMEHATPWSPYINPLLSNHCWASAYPNIVHITALSYTSRQVDPFMRYFTFMNILVVVFRLSPCSECSLCSFGNFPGIRSKLFPPHRGDVW